MPEKCILLEDTIAYKQTSKWNILSAKSFTEDQILRGSLLLELTEAESKESNQYFAPPLNYKKYSDDLVKLYCNPAEVLQLNDQQFNLLLGVKYPFDRFRALNILHWVEKLRVGFGVNVAISAIPNPVRGVIRYLGPLPGEEGIKFGIELLEKRGQGANDGTFKYTEYFKCERDCAMFVAMDKLSDPADSIAKPIQETVQPPLSQKQDGPLKLGDVVTFYDENDRPMKGVVRWIGRNTNALKNGSKIVGLETNITISSTSIPGSLAMMDHYFSSKASKVFLPIASVLKEEINPPTHPYNTRSKDKHDVCNVDPEDTLHLLQQLSKKEGQSATQFFSEQLEHQKNLELKKKKEEAKRQENLNKLPGKDFDVHKIDVSEQKRLYEEAQRASKQAGEEQKQVKGNVNAYSGASSGSQQYGGRQGHPSGIQQDSSVDPAGYKQNIGQQEFHRPQIPQHQNQQSGYHQGNHSSYGYSGGEQHYHNPQAPYHHQSQQPGYHQDVSYHQTQSNVQLPYPQADPAVHMAHIPRPCGAGNNSSHYNPATGMPYNYNGNTGHGPHRQVHQYEPVPGLVDQPDPYNQQRQHNPNPHNLEKGSMILHGEPPRPGIIKWIGHLPEANVLLAGIEMDDYMKGSSDGVWNGKKYFDSQIGRGIFVPIAHLRPDTRFGGGNENTVKPPNPLEIYRYEHGAENIQCATVVNKDRHVGRPKGIQGHQNSCYLDATVYGMFAFTDVFDKLFLKTHAKDKHDDKVRYILLRLIVNPLRKRDVVIYDSVMHLRTALDELVDNVQGLTSDEKDPEEFLNLLFKHVLFVEPFLHIRRPSGTDKEFFVQLFVEPDKSMAMPTTEMLLTKMFKEQDITFAKIPTRLLLQVPRYGKQFKSFDKTIPSLELEINELCDDYNHALCHVCGTRRGLLLCNTEGLSFCSGCSELWHGHPDRTQGGDHNIEDTSVKLKLISVICIETSHYVCFTRVTGSGDDQWLFFDSMAERQDDLYNIPEVRLCTNELEEEVYKNNKLTETPLNKLPELARRFVRDAYLCIYADPQQIMYDE